MIVDDLPLYQKKYSIRYNQPTEPFFYAFDYDERSYEINMEFQHFHPYYEICILFGDEATHIIEGQVYDLRPLDMVLLRPSVLHKTKYPVGAPKKRLIISFALKDEQGVLASEYQQLLTLFSQKVPIYRFEKAVQQTIFPILDQIFTCNRAPTELSGLMTYCKFMEFLWSVYHARAHNVYTVRPPDNATTHKMFDVSAYIHMHYSEPLSLQRLADHFYISTYYLSHQFKQVTGFTLVEYIQRTRINNAQQSLMFSNKKITQIADECGFSCFSQFNRVFKKFNGMSPSDYKKQIQAQC